MQAEVAELLLSDKLQVYLKVVMVEQEQQQIFQDHLFQKQVVEVVELMFVVTQVQQVQEQEEQVVEQRADVVLEL
tara:strand:- start:149 stop:373 length:225 start_codon:yes stop_codon:yes gene_type:complete